MRRIFLFPEHSQSFLTLHKYLIPLRLVCMTIPEGVPSFRYGGDPVATREVSHAHRKADKTRRRHT